MFPNLWRNICLLLTPLPKLSGSVRNRESRGPASVSSEYLSNERLDKKDEKAKEAKCERAKWPKEKGQMKLIKLEFGWVCIV